MCKEYAFNFGYIWSSRVVKSVGIQLYLCDADVQVCVDCANVEALMGSGCQHSLEGKAMPSVEDELQAFPQPPNYRQVSFVRIRP